MKKEKILLLLVILSLVLGFYNFYNNHIRTNKLADQGYTLIFWVPEDQDSVKYNRLHKYLYDLGLDGWSRFNNYGGWIDSDKDTIQEKGYIYIISFLNRQQVKNLRQNLYPYLKKSFKQQEIYWVVFREMSATP